MIEARLVIFIGVHDYSYLGMSTIDSAPILLPDFWERNNTVNDPVNALNEFSLLLGLDWFATLGTKVLDKDLTGILEQNSVQGGFTGFLSYFEFGHH